MQIRARSRFHPGAVLGATALGAALLFGSPAHAQSAAESALPWASQASQLGQMQQAAAAARKSLADFVRHYLEDSSTQGAPKHMPLAVADVQDLRHAVIGQGFQVHTVDPNDVLAGRTEVSHMVRPTGDWRFVVSVKGNPVGLVTMRQVAGKWEAVSFGGAELSKEVDSLMNRHGNADRSNLRFIRVYQAQSDFLEVTSPKDFSKRFAPLVSARRSLSLQQAASNADGLVEAGTFLDPLRNAIKANLAAFR